MIMILGFVSTSFPRLLGPYSIWMHTFPSMGRRGRALNFPQGLVPCPVLGLEEDGEDEWGSERRVGGGEEMEILLGIIYEVLKKLKKNSMRCT